MIWGSHNPFSHDVTGKISSQYKVKRYNRERKIYLLLDKEGKPEVTLP